MTAGLLPLSAERLDQVEILVRGGAALAAACREAGIHRESVYRSPRAAAIRALLIERGRAMKAPPPKKGHWCPLTRPSRRCEMRRRWAAGVYAGRRRGLQRNGWLPEHDGAVREVAGTMLAEQIAAELSRRFGQARTTRAVQMRAQRLGVSLGAVRAYTQQQIGRLLGCHQRSVTVHLFGAGLLRPHRESGGRKAARWLVSAAELERFLRACPWAYDWRRMRPGHPLTKVAEVVNRADPWLDAATACASLGIARTSLTRWLARGLVPHRRRPLGGCGGNRAGRLVVRRRDVAAIAEAMERGRAAANEGRRLGTLRRWQRARERVA